MLNAWLNKTFPLRSVRSVLLFRAQVQKALKVEDDGDDSLKMGDDSVKVGDETLKMDDDSFKMGDDSFKMDDDIKQENGDEEPKSLTERLMAAGKVTVPKTKTKTKTSPAVKGNYLCNYPVCGMVHIKEPLLLIEKSSLCGGSGFPLSLSEWFFTICPSFLPLAI